MNIKDMGRLELWNIIASIQTLAKNNDVKLKYKITQKGFDTQYKNNFLTLGKHNANIIAFNLYLDVVEQIKNNVNQVPISKAELEKEIKDSFWLTIRTLNRIAKVKNIKLKEFISKRTYYTLYNDMIEEKGINYAKDFSNKLIDNLLLEIREKDKTI